MTSTNPQPSVREAVSLKPCPFCGGEAEINQIGNEYTKSRGFEVKCLTWGCATKKRAMVIRRPIEEARAFAIEAWNRRADPLVEKLRGALEPFVQMAASLKADVSTAHSLRGNGASQWMREDDAEFRRDLSACLERAREALALPDGGGSSREPALSDDGGDQCSLATENARLREAVEVVRDLLDAWPESSLPSGPLCVRAAKVINANPKLAATTAALSHPDPLTVPETSRQGSSGADIAARVASDPAAGDAQRKSEEAGWLIERHDLDGIMYAATTRWDRDASKALRFARQEDAKAFFDGFLTSQYASVARAAMRIAEHRWG